MQASSSNKPFALSSTDHNFYLKAKKSQFSQASYLKINRLTSKIVQMTEDSYTQQLQSLTNKTYEEFMLLIGIIIVSQQPYLAIVKEAEPVATLNNTQKIMQIKDIAFLPFKHKFLYQSINQSQNEKILNYLRQNIINNNFYFSYQLDLTLTQAKRQDKAPTERKYFWNENMLKLFTHYHLQQCWRIPIVQGFVKEIYCENDYFSFYYVSISRRSKFMSGTRFNSRGIDQNCNASNFVETEELFICLNYIFSHASLRGSVPIFWDQEGFNLPIKFSHKDVENQNVLKKHYAFLQKEYKGIVLTINLLQSKKPSQNQLKNKFEFYYYRINKSPYLYFDLNEQMKDTQNGQKLIQKFIQQNYITMSPPTNFYCLDRHSHKVYNTQSVIARINCLDCIDRTNVIMSRISLMFLDQVQKYINQHSKMEEKKIHLTKEYYKEIIQIWVEIGNRISMLYCGTESVATHMTKQQNNSFFSFLSGGFKSLNRYYNASVADTFKQECIDYFLGEREELSNTKYFQDNITRGVIQEVKYCKYEETGVYILTWNCNTVDPEKLTSKDKEKLFNFIVQSVDIVVVCLQEMVQLNTYNALLGNNKNIVDIWKQVIQNHLNDMGKGKSYVSLTSYDLVGMCTMVFVSGAIYNHVYKQEWVEVKTGFKGFVGNKGAIILFLQIDSSYLTFINCHLAAGEGSQAERAQSIQYIHNDAINQRNRRRLFDKSQFRFLIGDMNFRLQAKNQHVRQILYTIQKKDSQKKMTKNEIVTYLEALLQKDEFYLNNQLHCLSTYSEPMIYFLPTYKYLKRKKQYDTKRTPSWCDRIFFYSQQKLKLNVVRYWDVDCYESDHKPVCGTFKILIKTQDLDRKMRLIQIYMNDA